MNKILFETVVGSHIWGMNHENSDIDIFRCYQADSEDLLLQKQPKNRNYLEVGKIDVQESELQTVLDQLVMNNYNYIVAVNSPIVRFDDTTLLEYLKKCMPFILSKQCYDSIHGLAVSNYKKYIESRKDVSEKRCNIIMRTVNFGIRLLTEGRISFEKVEGMTPEEVAKGIERLDVALADSKLQDRCPEKVKNALDKLLLDIRKVSIVS